MGRQLTKSEAIQLITPVIDNEVSTEEREAFMAFIAHNEEVRKEYQTMKKMKFLIKNRCSKAKAPESLKDFLSSLISSGSFDTDSPPIYDIPQRKSLSQESSSPQTDISSDHSDWWYFAAAAVLIITFIFGGLFNFSGLMTESTTYNIEEYAYQHFMKNEGKLVPPTISTASLGTAEIQLAEKYDMSMTIPELKKAEFKGVVYEEFVPNFKAPMLEYYLSSEDQYIYIFAFNLDKIEQFGQLVRNQEAVKTCNKSKDFHIRNINGKHVVSWKWNNTWYTAISNHDGSTLASLVEPLEYELSED